MEKSNLSRFLWSVFALIAFLFFWVPSASAQTELSSAQKAIQAQLPEGVQLFASPPAREPSAEELAEAVSKAITAKETSPGAIAKAAAQYMPAAAAQIMQAAVVATMTTYEGSAVNLNNVIKAVIQGAPPTAGQDPTAWAATLTQSALAGAQQQAGTINGNVLGNITNACVAATLGWVNQKVAITSDQATKILSEIVAAVLKSAGPGAIALAPSIIETATFTAAVTSTTFTGGGQISIATFVSQLGTALGIAPSSLAFTDMNNAAYSGLTLGNSALGSSSALYQLVEMIVNNGSIIPSEVTNILGNG